MPAFSPARTLPLQKLSCACPYWARRWPVLTAALSVYTHCTSISMRRPIPDPDYSEDDREQIMVVYYGYGTASLKAGGWNKADVGVISPLIAKG
jgi:hypothetical protein